MEVSKLIAIAKTWKHKTVEKYNKYALKLAVSLFYFWGVQQTATQFVAGRKIVVVLQIIHVSYSKLQFFNGLRMNDARQKIRGG